jgi:hypothetical protein
MHVQYKKTITDQLAEIRIEALVADKEIDYVELTNDEWAKLRREQDDLSTYTYLCFNDDITISGMRVIREQM